ncbi:PAS domain S-box protein [Acidithiobacillus ferruginosus]|uniref:PAS domain S-box protein n=1 Tax=Acidithiobacillus ferruginosus TaxID=3063951 RepID=A0ACD5IN49_9PROT
MYHFSWKYMGYTMDTPRSLTLSLCFHYGTDNSLFWRNLPLPACSSVFLLRKDGFLESRFLPPIQTTFGEKQNGIAAKFIRIHPHARFGNFYGLVIALNQRRLVAWCQVRGYPLIVGVGLPRAFLLTAWWKRMTGPFAALLVLLLLSTIAYWAFRRIGEDRQRERSAHDPRLWEAKERAEVSLHSIGDGEITTDIQGCVTDVNPVADAMQGYASDEILKQPIESVFRIVHELDRQAVENPIRRVLQEGRVVGLANLRSSPGIPAMPRKYCVTPIWLFTLPKPMVAISIVFMKIHGS